MKRSIISALGFLSVLAFSPNGEAMVRYKFKTPKVSGRLQCAQGLHLNNTEAAVSVGITWGATDKPYNFDIPLKTQVIEKGTNGEEVYAITLEPIQVSKFAFFGMAYSASFKLSIHVKRADGGSAWGIINLAGAPKEAWNRNSSPAEIQKFVNNKAELEKILSARLANLRIRLSEGSNDVVVEEINPANGQ